VHSTLQNSVSVVVLNEILHVLQILWCFGDCFLYAAHDLEQNIPFPRDMSDG